MNITKAKKWIYDLYKMVIVKNVMNLYYEMFNELRQVI